MKTYDRLIMMLNQIATNFAMEDDPAGAAAEHIGLFWDPRMKSMLIAGDGAGLIPAASAALALIRADALAKAA